MAELFNSKTVKRLCKDILISPTQEKAANDWLSKLDDNELEDEKSNYPDFMQIMLQDILGYRQKDIAYEKNNVEFQYPKNGERVLCIECKGTATKDLRALQKRVNEAHSTPINQTWSYMGKISSVRYGICTNYKKFELILKRKGTEKTHKFDFESIKKDKTKLQEFIGFFSKKYLIDEGLAVKCSVESEEEQKDLADEFYDLFHNTRLMLIKVFQEKQDVPKEEAIRFTQLYLNRLIFMFVAADKGLLGETNKNLFSERVYNVLKTSTDTSQKVAQEIIDLFSVIDKGSQQLGIDGFNGGLFKEIIPPNVFFLDLEDPNFFSEIKNKFPTQGNTKLENVKKTFRNKLNPIIENLLKMDGYNFETDLTVNILGHIFEQSITDLEEIRGQGVSQRKSEGVYYTPEWVTEQICKNVICRYLSNQRSDSVEKLFNEYTENIEELQTRLKEIKILDPACGSGAFLIKAVEILLEISKGIHDIKKETGAYTGLTEWIELEVLKNTIENNICGIDINAESMEITKLGLFLKIASKGKKLIAFNNLKTANSLTVNWEKEFPDVFASKTNPGFDCIVGNPPYVRQEVIQDKDKMQLPDPNTLGPDNFVIPSKSDLSSYFYYFGLHYLKDNGLLGYIASDSWLNKGYGRKLQETILANCIIGLLFKTQWNVFEAANTKTVTTILRKSSTIPAKWPVQIVYWGNKRENNYKKQIQQSIMKPSNWKKEYLDDPIQTPKIEMVELKDTGKFFRGVSTGINEFFLLDKQKIKQHKIDEKYFRSVIGDNNSEGLLDDRDAEEFLLNVNDTKRELMRTNSGKEVLKFLENAEKTKVIIKKGKEKGKTVLLPKLSTLASRKLWYSLNLDNPPAIFPARFADKRMKFFENNGNYFARDNFGCFTPNDTNHIHAFLAFFSSAWFALQMEKAGDTAGGGALQLLINEYQDLLVPDFSQLSNGDIKKMSKAWLDYRENFDRPKLDNIVLDVMGFNQEEKEDILQELETKIEERISDV